MTGLGMPDAFERLENSRWSSSSSTRRSGPWLEWSGQGARHDPNGLVSWRKLERRKPKLAVGDVNRGGARRRICRSGALYARDAADVRGHAGRGEKDTYVDRESAAARPFRRRAVINAGK